MSDTSDVGEKNSRMYNKPTYGTTRIYVYKQVCVERGGRRYLKVTLRNSSREGPFLGASVSMYICMCVCVGGGVYLKVTLRNSSLEGPFLGASVSMLGAEGSVRIEEVSLW